MIGETIEHYRILEVVGRGGMGIVYKALDVNLDRTVAVKVINAEMRDDPMFVERFRHEARIQAALNHPNIAMLFDFFVWNSSPVAVMELIEGETLQHRLQRSGPIPAHLALPIAVQALRGVAAGHRRGIIHRDLKPANLMVTEEGVVKVTDFGIAKLQTSTGLTQFSTRVGSSPYMSPEQILGRPVDTRTDIYAMGVTIYELLCGRPPFQAKTSFQIESAHVREMPLPPIAYNPKIPHAAVDAVMRALAKDPNDRFATADEFIQALPDLHGVPFVDPDATNYPAALAASARADVVSPDAETVLKPRHAAVVPVSAPQLEDETLLSAQQRPVDATISTPQQAPAGPGPVPQSPPDAPGSAAQAAADARLSMPQSPPDAPGSAAQAAADARLSVPQSPPGAPGSVPPSPTGSSAPRATTIVGATALVALAAVALAWFVNRTPQVSGTSEIRTKQALPATPSSQIRPETSAAQAPPPETSVPQVQPETSAPQAPPSAPQPEPVQPPTSSDTLPTQPASPDREAHQPAKSDSGPAPTNKDLSGLWTGVYADATGNPQLNVSLQIRQIINGDISGSLTYKTDSDRDATCSLEKSSYSTKLKRLRLIVHCHSPSHPRFLNVPLDFIHVDPGTNSLHGGKLEFHLADGIIVSLTRARSA